MASRKDVYTDEEKAEIAAFVIVRVATGQFVSRVFRENKVTSNGIKMPARETFYGWLFEDKTGELDNKLARAREYGIEALLDEVTDITDDASNDTIVDENGYKRANTEWISRSRLRAEYRVKLAQMLKPKKYGPKLDVTSGGKPIGIGDKLDAMQAKAVELYDPEGDKE